MKRVVIAFMVMALILASLPLTGCGSSSGLINMMKRMPEGINGFVFEDFREARTLGAGELNEGYGGYLDIWEENLLEVGINLGDVDSLVQFASYSVVFLIEGDFNLDDIREKLEEDGLNSGEYRGVEIWAAGDNVGEETWEGGIIYALISSRLIAIGFEQDIDKLIGVIDEGAASIFDNNDFRDTIERLPDGLTVQCSMQWYTVIEDIIIGGFSLVMNSDGTQDFTWVGRFNNSEAATAAIDVIINETEDFLGFGLVDMQATQDGEYVTVTAENQEIY